MQNDLHKTFNISCMCDIINSTVIIAYDSVCNYYAALLLRKFISSEFRVWRTDTMINVNCYN